MRHLLPSDRWVVDAYPIFDQRSAEAVLLHAPGFGLVPAVAPVLATIAHVLGLQFAASELPRYLEGEVPRLARD